MAVILTGAKISLSPILPRPKSERNFRTPSATVSKLSPISQLHSNRIKPLRTTESNNRSHRRRGQTRQITKPSPMRTARELTLPQRTRKRPGKVHQDRIMVRKNITQVIGVRVREFVANIGETLRSQSDNIRASV